MYSFRHSRWNYALPAPAFFALGGTLVFKWLSDFDEGAAIAANFVVSSLVLVPIAILMSDFGGQTHQNEPSAAAVSLLLLGTLAASGAGRVFYQMALTATENDNGYVTMYFLLMPLSALFTLLSRWIPDLRFHSTPLFFLGAGLVSVPLVLLALASRRGSVRLFEASLSSNLLQASATRLSKGAADPAANRKRAGNLADRRECV